MMDNYQSLKAGEKDREKQDLGTIKRTDSRSSSAPHKNKNVETGGVLFAFDLKEEYTKPFFAKEIKDTDDEFERKFDQLKLNKNQLHPVIQSRESFNKRGSEDEEILEGAYSIMNLISSSGEIQPRKAESDVSSISVELKLSESSVSNFKNLNNTGVNKEEANEKVKSPRQAQETKILRSPTRENSEEINLYNCSSSPSASNNSPDSKKAEKSAKPLEEREDEILKMKKVEEVRRNSNNNEDDPNDRLASNSHYNLINSFNDRFIENKNYILKEKFMLPGAISGFDSRDAMNRKTQEKKTKPSSPLLNYYGSALPRPTDSKNSFDVDNSHHIMNSTNYPHKMSFLKGVSSDYGQYNNAPMNTGPMVNIGSGNYSYNFGQYPDQYDKFFDNQSNQFRNENSYSAFPEPYNYQDQRLPPHHQVFSNQMNHMSSNNPHFDKYNHVNKINHMNHINQINDMATFSAYNNDVSSPMPDSYVKPKIGSTNSSYNQEIISHFKPKGQGFARGHESEYVSSYAPVYNKSNSHQQANFQGSGKNDHHAFKQRLEHNNNSVNSSNRGGNNRHAFKEEIPFSVNNHSDYNYTSINKRKEYYENDWESHQPNHSNFERDQGQGNDRTRNIEKIRDKTANNESKLVHNYFDMTDEELAINSIDLAKEQGGCRYLQKKVEEDKNFTNMLLFPALQGKLLELMNDSFGNYLVQKIVENLNVENFFKVLNLIEPNLLKLGLSPHGTRVVQKVIERLSEKKLLITFNKILYPNIIPLLKDVNANHIVIKYVFTIPFPENNFVYEVLHNYLYEVAIDKHGCCVLQKCIEAAQDNQRNILIKRLVNMTNNLMLDQYGNYVLQYIITLGNYEVNNYIAGFFLKDIGHLSKQKFSSNVIEKCFENSNQETKDLMVKELAKPFFIESLLTDMYGNYVLQKAMAVAKEPYLDIFIQTIAPIMDRLKNVQFGPKLHTKLLNTYSKLHIAYQNSYLMNKAHYGGQNSFKYSGTKSNKTKNDFTGGTQLSSGHNHRHQFTEFQTQFQEEQDFNEFNEYTPTDFSVNSFQNHTSANPKQATNYNPSYFQNTHSTHNTQRGNNFSNPNHTNNASSVDATTSKSYNYKKRGGGSGRGAGRGGHFNKQYQKEQLYDC